VENEMAAPTALVIGAGIGGITTAAYLAREGYQVTVIEKCEQAGGRCGRMVRDGHRFDTGPTLFVMPELYIQAFMGLGERIEDHLELRRVDPGYHIHFEDGTNLSLTSDLNAMQAQLDAIEPGSFRGFLRYISEGYLHYKLSLRHMVKRNFRTPWEFFTLKNLLLFLRLNALSDHYKNLGKYFNDHRLKVAFGFQNMYMGLSPYEAPAIYSLLQYTEFADGIWFPIGGMYRIIEALVEIAQKWDVQFSYNTTVDKINTDGRKVCGVMLADGTKMQADVVIANADLPYVYRDLLPNDGTVDKLESRKYGCSTVMFYWGLQKQFPQLATHNLFIVGDYRQGFDRIFKDLTIPEEPSFYVHAPVRLDPSLAPVGQDTLVVAVPVGHISDTKPQDWDAIIAKARKTVVQRLDTIGVSDLEENIKFEVSYTPHDWKSRYNLNKGSTHGLNHNLMQMGYLRPHNRHKNYHNLYFVGASTHPGTGLPTVLVSAQLVVERILKEIGATLPNTGKK
jgi:phytoene desaturase